MLSQCLKQKEVLFLTLQPPSRPSTFIIGFCVKVSLLSVLFLFVKNSALKWEGTEEFVAATALVLVMLAVIPF